MIFILDSAWETLSRVSWNAMFVFPIAWLVCHVLKKLPRRLHCWIWRIAYAKVIVATFWIVPITLPLLPFGDARPIETANVLLGDGENMANINSESLQIVVAPNDLHWTHVLVIAWFIGFLTYMIRSFREWAYSLRIRSIGRPIVSGPVFELYGESAAAMGVAIAPPLLETSEIDMPALVGLIRPAIVVPSGFLAQVDHSELSLVLRHELGHLRRLDLVWNLLHRIVDTVLFFHPLAWLASRRSRISQEAACDELVLKSPGAHSKNYASMLIRVAEFTRQNRDSQLSTIGVVSSFRSLSERIKAMQNTTSWSNSGFVLAASSLLVISFVSIVPWKLIPQYSPARFLNRDFEEGDTTGWTITPGQNAVFGFDGVIQFDIDGSGSTSNVFSLSVGQISNEQGVYRSVDVTQDLSLEQGEEYQFSFDWAVKNFYAIDNFDGGVFELIVESKVEASFDTQNVFTESIERGTLKARFTPTQSGFHSVGARISRRFPISFPKSPDPTLLQYLDNFSVSTTSDFPSASMPR